MPDKIQLARGKAENMPLLADGEPGFATDTEELYVGYGGRNIPVRDKETLKLVEEQGTKLGELETALDGKLSATAVAAQAAVGADAELGTVIEALNALITAMKTSGVMQA